MNYRPEEIGRMLQDLEVKHSNILTQDIGHIARSDVTVIAKFLSKAARTEVSKLMHKSEIKYYIEFVKVEDGSCGDLWNFFVHTSSDGKGIFHRLVKTPSRIVVERKGPEALRVQRRRKRIEDLIGQQGETGDSLARLRAAEAELHSKRLRLREVRRHDFERLFLSRNPLGEFRYEDFVTLGRYVASIQNMPGMHQPWITLEETPVDGDAQFVIKVHELAGAELKLSRRYPISHTRDKGDYRVVYSMLSGDNKSVALFRLYRDSERCAINDNIIPPMVNKALSNRGL